MRLAVPIYRLRVSPVFDFSTRVLIIELEQEEERGREEIDFTGLLPSIKVERLKEAGVDTLICAGLSMPFHRMLTMAGLEIISGIVGPVEELISAFKSGHLQDGRFLMPGCCRKRKRGRGRCLGF
jgi:predicted Fe-Mo cluster-binding NifX family protein